MIISILNTDSSQMMKYNSQAFHLYIQNQHTAVIIVTNIYNSITYEHLLKCIDNNIKQ